MAPDVGSGKRVAVCVAIPVAFAVVRYFIYAAYPVEPDDWYRWFLRDEIMTLPRLACVAAAWIVGRRWWSRRELGLHARGAGLASLLLAATVLPAFIPPGLMGPLTPGWIRFGILTIPVALWEELVYLGVLFNALREWKGVHAAIVLSAMLFTVVHVQAQPVAGWPILLVSGLAGGVLRARGVSLWWLMLIHWADDTLWYGISDLSLAQNLVLPVRMALVAVVLWPRRAPTETR